MRTAFGWLLLGLAALSACGRETPAAAASASAASAAAKKAGSDAAARLTIAVDRRDVGELASLPLDEARRQRTNAFRLAPDRRFLIALSEIDLLLRRASRVRLHVAYRDGAWRIDSSGVPVGSVAEAAGYREYRRVLGEYAR